MFAESPTEPSTGITDLFLSLQALGAIWVLNKNVAKRPVWTDHWTWFLGLLSAASLPGPYCLALNDHVGDWIPYSITAM